MASQIQRRTLTNQGGAIEEEFVTLETNQIDPQMDTPVITFECPKSYSWIHFNGSNHPTRFVPRRVQEVSGTANDDTVVALDNDIFPIAGEPKIEDQEFPVVVAADADGNEVEIENVDYATNEVTLAQDPADGATWYVYPVVTEGTLNVRGLNQFDQKQGTLSEWGKPLYRFSDFPQLKRGTKINLDGEVRWTHNERIQFIVDSPYEIAWTHAAYPNGAYVSEFEQDVDIKL